MKFSIREMMMAILLVSLFVRWVAVDVVYRQRIVKSWEVLQVDVYRIGDRVRRLEKRSHIHE